MRFNGQSELSHIALLSIVAAIVGALAPVIGNISPWLLIGTGLLVLTLQIIWSQIAFEREIRTKETQPIPDQMFNLEDGFKVPENYDLAKINAHLGIESRQRAPRGQGTA